MACSLLTSREIMGGEYQCSLCGSEKIEEIGTIQRPFNLFKCNKCQLFFILPRPKQEELKMAYKGFNSDIGKLKPREAERISVRYYKIIKSYCPEAKKILEIGCSTGHILYGLKQYGYEIQGTDLSSRACQLAQEYYGVKVHDAEFPPPESQDSFDVIIMSHLIEHVPEPKAFITKATKFLKPNGILIISTPNSKSLGFRIFRGHYPVINPPFHLNFFNKKTLSFLTADRYQIKEVKSHSTDSLGRNPFFHDAAVGFLNFFRNVLGKKRKLWTVVNQQNSSRKEKKASKSILLRCRKYSRKILQVLFSPFFLLLDKFGWGENITLVGGRT